MKAYNSQLQTQTPILLADEEPKALEPRWDGPKAWRHYRRPQDYTYKGAEGRISTPSQRKSGTSQAKLGESDHKSLRAAPCRNRESSKALAGIALSPLIEMETRI